jgi:hypothetical protein
MSFYGRRDDERSKRKDGIKLYFLMLDLAEPSL